PLLRARPFPTANQIMNLLSRLRPVPISLALALATSGAARAQLRNGNLGSLTPVLKSIHQQNGFPMEFARRGDLSVAEWQRRGRAEVDRTLSYRPPSVPLDLKVRSVTSMDGYEVRDITFATSPHYRVP